MLSALLLAGALLAPPAAAASWDPKLTWQVLRTDHFVIHFHDGEEQLAREMAVDAEVAWDKLVPELGNRPRKPIQVVLLDWTDSANGYASLTPQNHIFIFVTAPEGDSTLGLYRDWNEAIFTHELTHILHLSSVTGLPKVARTLLGTYISTHQLEPRWIVEGFATYMETRHTVGGRGRSGLVDMVKRAAVLEDNFPPLGNMDGFQPLAPGGNLRYLFGQDFIQFVADRAGEGAWPEWVKQYGRSLPLFYNFRRALGGKEGEDGPRLTLLQLYRGWEQHMRERYAAQVAPVKAEGVTPTTTVSEDGLACGGPAWSPTGDRLAFACADPRRGNDIWMSTDGAPPEILIKNRAAGELEWRSDGKALAWAQSHTVDLYNSFNDVVLYDLEKKKSKWLTSGQRARDPEFSPDGTRMYVVTNEAQDNQLAVLTVDGRLTPLTDRKDHTNFGWPQMSPDGRQLAVSVWENTRRDLWLYTPEGAPARRLTWDDAIDIDPAWSPDGRWLYFASDRSGIPNIYAVDTTNDHLYRVTNVLTGAYGPAPHPDGTKLAFQLYSTAGAKVVTMALDPATFKDLGSLPRWGAPVPGPTAPPAAVVAPVPPEAPPVPPAASPAPPEAAPAPPEAAPAPPAAPAAPSESSATSPEPAAALPAEPTPLATLPLPPPHPGPDPLARRDDLPALPYNPLPTLFPPRFWLPSGYLTTTGESLGLLGAAATYGQDILQWFSYSAYLTYRTDAGFLGGGGSFTVNRWRTVFGASAYTAVTPYGDIYELQPEEGGAYVPGVVSSLTRYWDHRTRASLSLRHPLTENASFYAFYSGTLRRPLDPLPTDGSVYYPALPTRGFFSSVGAGWSRAKGESYALSISPEQARTLAVGVELTPFFLGSSTYDDENNRVPFTQVQATAEWREYRTAPWLPNHVLAWKLAGGATLGDRFRYGSFRLGGSFSENGITVVPSEWRTLRGYYPASDGGEWYWLASGEYRFPLWQVNRGVGTIPVFARFLSGTVFVDAGNAFDEASGATLDQTLLGVGAELDVYFLYLYGAGMYARLGYGFAPRGDGIPFGSVDGAYLALGSSF